MSNKTRKLFKQKATRRQYKKNKERLEKKMEEARTNNTPPIIKEFRKLFKVLGATRYGKGKINVFYDADIKKAEQFILKALKDQKQYLLNKCMVAMDKRTKKRGGW